MRFPVTFFPELRVCFVKLFLELRGHIRCRRLDLARYAITFEDLLLWISSEVFHRWTRSASKIVSHMLKPGLGSFEELFVDTVDDIYLPLAEKNTDNNKPQLIDRCLPQVYEVHCARQTQFAKICRTWSKKLFNLFCTLPKSVWLTLSLLEAVMELFVRKPVMRSK